MLFLVMLAKCDLRALVMLLQRRTLGWSPLAPHTFKMRAEVMSFAPLLKII